MVANNSVAHRILKGTYDDSIYRQRVNRSQAWLGETEEEQYLAQEKLKNATVGVAGCGGIGGACAMRLARLGVRHIKVADLDNFDWTNVNRQMGSEVKTIGHNKADTVGKMVYELAGDVTVEIFNEGITKENAEEFVSGCDLVLDQMDFYLLGERYALHKAFRNSEKTKYILSAWCVGWGTSMYKWTKDGMSIEDFFGIPEDEEINADIIQKLIRKFMPKNPKFPNIKVIEKWLIEDKTVPLFAGTPPVAEGAVIPRAALILTDLEDEKHANVLPAAPDVYWYDSSTLESKILKYENGEFHE